MYSAKALSQVPKQKIEMATLAVGGLNRDHLSVVTHRSPNNTLYLALESGLSTSGRARAADAPFLGCTASF